MTRKKTKTPRRLKAPTKKADEPAAITSVEPEAFKHAEPIRITASLERQQWLEAAVEALRTRFADAGYRVPEKVRVSIGWPKRAASCGAIGECWSTAASSDAHNELFISPELTEAARILGVLGHEMVHATVGTDAGHRKPFKRCANAIGLQGPMRATIESAEFVAWAEMLVDRIGPYPAGFLTDSKKQGTRLQRCECPGCGYLARVSAKWLFQSGPPICPSDKIPMKLQTAGATEQSCEREAA
jgi:hypothetical protein